MDKGWYDGIAYGVRLQSTPDDEGGTWVLFLDADRRPINAMALPAEELGPLELDGLVEVVDGVDAPAVIVAVPRIGRRTPRRGLALVGGAAKADGRRPIRTHRPRGRR